MASKKKPDDLSMGYFIILIAKYYLSDEIDAESLSKIVKEQLTEFDLDNYQEYKYHNKIMKICTFLLVEGKEKIFRDKKFVLF